MRFKGLLRTSQFAQNVRVISLEIKKVNREVKQLVNKLMQGGIERWIDI